MLAEFAQIYITQTHSHSLLGIKFSYQPKSISIYLAWTACFLLSLHLLRQKNLTLKHTFEFPAFEICCIIFPIVLLLLSSHFFHSVKPKKYFMKWTVVYNHIISSYSSNIYMTRFLSRSVCAQQWTSITLWLFNKHFIVIISLSSSSGAW